MIAGDHDLGTDRFGMFRHQRQKPMRRAAGDNLQFAHLLEFAERADEVASVAVAERGAGLLKTVVIEPSEIVECPVPLRALDFRSVSSMSFVMWADVAILQQRIEEHRAQGRRQRHRETEVHVCRARVLPSS